MATSSVTVMLEDQPNSGVILGLLQSEFLNGELAPIAFGGFLERAASLLWKQLGCSQDDIEDQEKLQYTACILWALFSSPNLQKKYAQLLYEHPAFVHSTLQLNYSLLKARYLGGGEVTGDLAMANTFSTLIMIAVPHCDELKDQLAECGYVRLMLQLLKCFPMSIDEEMLRATAVNLQIIYHCVERPTTHSLCNKTLCAQAIEPLLCSKYTQLRLISKALLVRLQLPDPELTADEVAALLQFLSNIHYDDLVLKNHLSLVNLLLVTNDLVKFPQNKEKLASADALPIFLELTSDLNDDLQQIVSEIIQMVSLNEGIMEVVLSCLENESGVNQVEEDLSLEVLMLEEMDASGSMTVCDIEPSESNLKLEMCTEEESTLRLVTNMLHFMTQYTNGQKLAVSAMRNVTVAFVFIADITSQSDDQFQEKVVQEIAMVPGICRIILENICHSDELGDNQPVYIIESFMVWTHYSARLCRELGNSGAFQYLAAILHAANTCKMPSEVEINIVLQTLTVFLNFAYDTNNMPMFESGEIVPILLKFARCPQFEVSFLSRIILSFVAPLLTCSELASLNLNEFEANYIASAIQNALNSPDREAEGYTLTELLQIASSFTNYSSDKVPAADWSGMLQKDDNDHIQQEATGEFKLKAADSYRENHDVIPECTKEVKDSMEENKVLLMETNLCSSIEKLLCVPDEVIQTATIKLLWNLLHCPSFQQQVLLSYPLIIHSVQQIQQHSTTQLKLPASCILKLLESDEAEITPLQYAQVCYNYGNYKECMEVCDMIKSPDQELLLAKLLKGKAVFHGYQPVLRYLMENKHYLSKQDTTLLIQKCFGQMKDAIILLGDVLDSQCIDSEGSQLLDFAMMDCIRETNQLNQCKRCLLCRRQTKLRKSHVWSESIIKHVSKKKFSNTDAKNIMFGHNKHFLKSPGMCTFWMLCSKCEELLNQNGENRFCGEFYDRITVNQVKINYDSWLFDFCIGILFRTMSTLIMYDCLNSDEIYNAFLHCRKHLLSLPVTIAGEPLKLSPLEQYQVATFCSQDSVSLTPLLLVTPDDVSRSDDEKLFCKGFDTFLQYYSERQMKTGLIDCSGQVHFFLTYCAPIAIILQFSPSASCVLPDHCYIKPRQAVTTVPNIHERIQLIPKGVWEALYDYQQFYLDSNLEVSRSLSATAATKLRQCLPQLQPLASPQELSVRAPDASSDCAAQKWNLDSETLNIPDNLPDDGIPFSTSRTSNTKTLSMNSATQNRSSSPHSEAQGISSDKFPGDVTPIIFSSASRASNGSSVSIASANRSMNQDFETPNISDKLHSDATPMTSSSISKASDTNSLSIHDATLNRTLDSETQSISSNKLPGDATPMTYLSILRTSNSSNVSINIATPNSTPDSEAQNISSDKLSSDASPVISSSTKSRYGATATHAGSSWKDSFQLHTRLYRLQLLPRGFEIKRLSQKLQFSVPEGHQILLHTWCNQLPENIELTCFLGLGSSAGFSPDKPYFILIQYIPQENLLVSDGAFITLDDPVKVSNYLLEHTFSSPIRIPLEEMNDLISVMLPTMLEQQGHTTIHTLMRLANYYRPFHNQGGILSLEFCCSSEGCWYCRNRCLTCMRPAAPWSGVSGEADCSKSFFGFCTRACKEVFCGEDGTYAPIVPEGGQPEEILFQQLSTIRPPNVATNIVDFLHVCIGDGSFCLPLGKPYAIWQFRNTQEQLFVSFFLSDDCDPQEPVWHPHRNSSVTKAMDLVFLHLKQRLHCALQDLQFKNLSALVASRLSLSADNK